MECSGVLWRSLDKGPQKLCQGWGRGFESLRPLHFSYNIQQLAGGASRPDALICANRFRLLVFLMELSLVPDLRAQVVPYRSQGAA